MIDKKLEKMEMRFIYTRSIFIQDYVENYGEMPQNLHTQDINVCCNDKNYRNRIVDTIS